MRRGDGSEDTLVRLAIERLEHVKLLRLYLVAGLLVGPHAANDFLFEAVQQVMKPERDPTNPRDDLGKRLIEIILTIQRPNFVNPPSAEDTEEIEQLLKREGDPRLVKHDVLVRLRRSVLSRVTPAPPRVGSPGRRSPQIAPHYAEVKELVTPERISAVLGGEPILGHRVSTEADLQNAVEEGLPAAALDNAIDRIGYVPVKLRAVYKRLSGPLPMELSEKVVRLARVIAVAEYVFDNDAAARRFLATPRRLLSSMQTPLDAAMDDAGARKVEKVLASIFHGLPV